MLDGGLWQLRGEEGPAMATVDAVVCLLADAGCQAEGLSHRGTGATSWTDLAESRRLAGPGPYKTREPKGWQGYERLQEAIELVQGYPTGKVLN